MTDSWAQTFDLKHILSVVESQKEKPPLGKIIPESFLFLKCLPDYLSKKYPKGTAVSVELPWEYQAYDPLIRVSLTKTFPRTDLFFPRPKIKSVLKIGGYLPFTGEGVATFFVEKKDNPCLAEIPNFALTSSSPTKQFPFVEVAKDQPWVEGVSQQAFKESVKIAGNFDFCSVGGAIFIGGKLLTPLGLMSAQKLSFERFGAYDFGRLSRDPYPFSRALNAVGIKIRGSEKTKIGFNNPEIVAMLVQQKIGLNVPTSRGGR